MEVEANIVRDIYAAALDEKPLIRVIEKTARILGATGAFFFTTFISEESDGIAVSTGIPVPEAQRFLSEVATVDVWFHELLRRHGELHVGLHWQSDNLLSEAEVRKTRLFADYLVPSDIGRNLGIMIGDGLSEDLPLAPLCFYRPVRSRPFSAENEAQLISLGSHFTRALSVRQRLRAAGKGSAERAIERIGTAVLVLARDRKILFSNPAADDLLARVQCDGFSLVRDRRLCSRDSTNVQALEKALQACATYRFDGRLSLSVRLAGNPGDGVVARLVPPPPATPKGDKAAAIAFLSQEGRVPIKLNTIVTSLYKLTPMESALVMALTEGIQPEAFAESRCVALSTVKTQLRSVFAKTGTRRQTELIRLMLSIAH